ncbi:MAG: hypothetical protein ABIN89_05720 [Chitinophagaceae bacterium]
MQELENNLDNLFQKAAENYPLRTSKDDWNEIIEPLLNEPVVLTGNKKSFFKNNTSLLIFIFTLLPLTVFDTKTNGSKSSPENVSRQQLKENVMAAIGIKVQVEPGLIKIAGKNNSHPLPSNTGKFFLQRSNQSVASIEKNNVKNQLPQQPITETNTSISKLKTGENKQPDAVSDGNITEKEIATGQKAADTTTQAPIDLIANTGKRNGFYWGAVLGPSGNQVKNQRLKKPGYDIGLVAGYQFNKKLSIEAGLLFEKKYYFSDGKYFNMAKAGASMPVGMKILSLDGSFSVFEVPIKLRYNLAGNNTRHFYITSGISTYIITNEYNKYTAVINGVQQNVTGDYNNMSRYAAAVVDAGFGFDNSIGRNSRVRIEPYIQVPLQGIGIGSLQVTTVGLHLGLLRAKN